VAGQTEIAVGLVAAEGEGKPVVARGQATQLLERIKFRPSTFLSTAGPGSGRQRRGNKR
jgi:hypothetical protein